MFRLSVAFLLVALSISPVQADTRIWDGQGLNTNWDNPDNWGGAFPIFTDNADFDGNTDTPDTINGVGISITDLYLTPNNYTVDIYTTGNFTFNNIIVDGNSDLDPAFRIDAAVNVLPGNAITFQNSDQDTILELTAGTALYLVGIGLNVDGSGTLKTGNAYPAFGGSSVTLTGGAKVGTVAEPIEIATANQPAEATVNANSELIFSYEVDNPTVATDFFGAGDITYVQQGNATADFSGGTVLGTFTGRATFNLFDATSEARVSPVNAAGLSAIEINTGILAIAESGSALFDISGDGGLEITGGNTLDLLGTCTYEGTTSIPATNEITGSTETFSNSSTVSCEGTLTFEQNTDGTFAPVISGAGIISKTGLESLVLSATHTFTGQVNVTAGTLQCTGSLSQATVDVSNGATFKGNTTVNGLSSSGTVAPGNSIGTLTVLGNYTSDANSNLEIEVSPTQADLLDITGTATLDGTLTLLPETGSYTQGTTYTVVDADGGLGGTTFDTIVNNSQIDLSVSYTTNSVILTVLTSTNVIPIPISQLRGNPKAVADYLYANAFSAPSGSELANAITALNGLSTQEFPIGLLKMSQLPYLGLQEVNLQNDVRVADLFQSNYRRFCQNQTNEKNKGCSGQNRWSLFAEPIFYFYHQEQDQGKLTDIGQVAFDAYTYGTSAGVQYNFKKNVSAQLGLGYTHSDVYWKQEFASGYFNTVYLGPVIGWSNPNVFLNLTAMAAINFYDLSRKIEFGTYSQRATTEHTSYDFLLELDGAYKYAIEGMNLWYLVPEAKFNYLSLVTPTYYESGASDLNLKVYNQYNVWFQPNFKLRVLKEFYGRKVCFSPSVFIGWLANIPVTKNKSKARFKSIETERRFFELTGMNETTNQLMLGLEMAVQNCDQFKASVSLEYDVQDKYQIYEANARLDWFF